MDEKIDIKDTGEFVNWEDKMKKTLFAAIIMLLLIPIALAQDIKINGATDGTKISQNALGDTKAYLDARGVELAHTSVKAWNWIVNTIKLITPPFMQNGIPYSSLTSSEKSFLASNGVLPFNPTIDKRYVNTAQDLALQQSGKSPYVAVIGESVHDYYDSAAQKLAVAVDPTLTSMCNSIGIDACRTVIPITYTDKTTGLAKQANTIAGRTEMDFTSQTDWTLKEYVPQGTQTSYYYDRSGNTAKVETYQIGATQPAVQQTTSTPSTPPVNPETPDNQATNNAVNPQDNTASSLMIAVGIILISLIAVVLIATVLIKNGKKRK